MAMRHPTSERFHQILKELGDLHDRKSKDYGRTEDPFANVRATEEWGQAAWVGSMIRATDKLRRLQKVAQGGQLANEGVEDSFRDLAVYAVIGLVLWEQDRQGDLLELADIARNAEQMILPFTDAPPDCPLCEHPRYVNPVEEWRCSHHDVRWA